MDYNDVIRAVEGRNWYALAVFAVFALVLLSKKLAPKYYYKIPDGYRWIPPLALAAATGFIDSYYAQLPWKQALIRAGYAVLTMGFGAAGAHGLLKESPFPYGGGPGGKPLKDGGPSRDEALNSGVLKMTAIAVLFLLVGSCAESKPYIRTADDAASWACSAFYGKKQGISLDEAARTFCKTKAQLQPWIDQLLALERQGVPVEKCEPATEVTVTKVDGGS